MNSLFVLVRDALVWISTGTGFSYREINILAYFLLLPLILAALLDRADPKRRHLAKIVVLAVWVGALAVAPDFPTLANTMFEVSVRFLLLLGAIGLDYVAASVLVCVALPLSALATLAWLAFRRRPSGR